MVGLEAVDRRHASGWESLYRLVDLQPWECDVATFLLRFHGGQAGGSASLGRHTGN